MVAPLDAKKDALGILILWFRSTFAFVDGEAIGKRFFVFDILRILRIPGWWVGECAERTTKSEAISRYVISCVEFSTFFYFFGIRLRRRKKVPKKLKK